MRKGFTLLECTLAGAILSLLAVVFLEGVSVATRISADNARLLAADGVAWDALWTAFNRDYASIKPLNVDIVEDLSEDVAPMLYYGEGAPARLTMRFCQINSRLRSVEADVEWGPEGRRRRLSDFHGGRLFVYRSDLKRVKKE